MGTLKFMMIVFTFTYIVVQKNEIYAIVLESTKRNETKVYYSLQV